MDLIAKIILAIMSLYLAGCAGLGNRYGTEEEICNSQCKIVWGYGGYFIPSHNQSKVSDSEQITKSNLLKYFGKPDYISKKGDIETWKYSQFRWVGVIPYIVVPIPLMLPVGSDSVEITFENDAYTNVVQHMTQDSTSVCSILPVIADGGGFCWSKKGRSKYQHESK